MPPASPIPAPGLAKWKASKKPAPAFCWMNFRRAAAPRPAKTPIRTADLYYPIIGKGRNDVRGLVPVSGEIGPSSENEASIARLLETVEFIGMRAAISSVPEDVAVRIQAHDPKI